MAGLKQQVSDNTSALDGKVSKGTHLVTLEASAVEIDGVPSEISGELLLTL